MAKVLVTGASGFIGSHLVEALIARGEDVTCLVRSSSNRARLESLGVGFAVGDINDAASLGPAVANAEVVYHLAAMLKQPWHADFLTTNADGVRNVVAAAAARGDAPPTVVMTSSVAAVGPSPDGAPLTEAWAPSPVSKYGRSKLNGELAAREYAGQVPVTVVRPPAVFGERDTAMLPMFKSAARGLHVVPGAGTARLSMVHVADLVQALIAAAARGERLPANEADAAAGTGVYFAADERRPTITKLGELLGSAVGRDRVRVFRAPRVMTRALGGVAEGVARLRRKPSIINLDKMTEATAGSWVCSPAKALDQLGWHTSVPLAERLLQTGSWYRTEAWI